jgi:hypothetical protein
MSNSLIQVSSSYSRISAGLKYNVANYKIQISDEITTVIRNVEVSGSRHNKVDV